METTTTAPAATTVTVSYNPNWVWVEVHAEGCAQAGRKVRGTLHETEVGQPHEASVIVNMIANPDEGAIKVHACAKALLRAAGGTGRGNF